MCVCVCDTERGEGKQPLLGAKASRSDAGCDDDEAYEVVDLTRVSIYLVCIQSTVAAIGAQIALALSACFLSGSAARTILIYLFTGAVLTNKPWTTDLGCKIVLHQILVPLTILVPIFYLMLIQLEAGTSHERLLDAMYDGDGVPIELHVFDASRTVVTSCAIVLAGLGALERSFWPRSSTSCDLLLSSTAIVLVMVLHPTLDDLEALPDPLCMCPSSWEVAMLRGSRVLAWICVSQTTVLCTLPNILDASATPRVLLYAASSALWTLLVPFWALLASTLQIALLIMRRNAVGGCLDSKSVLVKPPAACMRVVHCLVRTAASIMKGLESLRDCKCSFSVPWRFAPEEPLTHPLSNQSQPAPSLPPRRPPIIDCTGLHEHALVERMATRVYGTDDASVGVAKLISQADGNPLANPYTARTFQRLSATLASR